MNGAFKPHGTKHGKDIKRKELTKFESRINEFKYQKK